MKSSIRVIGLLLICFELAYFIFVEPRFETLSAFRQRTDTLLGVQDMGTALLSYKMGTDHYPTTQQGLMALIQPPAGVTRWAGPYLKNKTTPLDPWRNPYHYRYPGIHNRNGYDVWSSGPDGIDGTADDIGNW